jgi:hypothetical protein
MQKIDHLQQWSTQNQQTPLSISIPSWDRNNHLVRTDYI